MWLFLKNRWLQNSVVSVKLSKLRITVLHIKIMKGCNYLCLFRLPFPFLLTMPQPTLAQKFHYFYSLTSIKQHHTIQNCYFSWFITYFASSHSVHLHLLSSRSWHTETWTTSGWGMNGCPAWACPSIALTSWNHWWMRACLITSPRRSWGVSWKWWTASTGLKELVCDVVPCDSSCVYFVFATIP